MKPTLKNPRGGAVPGDSSSWRPRRPRVRVVPEASLTEEITDRLGSLPDRPDLERLFERQVDVPTLLRLIARQVSRHEVQDLLESKHFERDLQALLG